MLTSSRSWQPRSLARRLISGIYKQQCLHHPALSTLDPCPVVRFLASAAAILTSSSSWHSRSLAHRPVSGFCTCNAYIIQLLAFWILGLSSCFWHLQLQCLHYPALSILDPWPLVLFLTSAAAMLTSSSSRHSGSLVHRPVSGILSSNSYIIQLLAI
jgi:hypothetical protein